MLAFSTNRREEETDGMGYDVANLAFTTCKIIGHSLWSSLEV